MPSLVDRLNVRWSAFASSPWRALILALVFSLFFCGVTELAWVRNDLNDDYAIANVLSGKLMGEQGLCLFLNAVLCQIIYTLNTIYPHFNWFAVLELVTVFVSYTIICYMAIRCLRFEMSMLTIALVAYFTLPGSFTINNFTYVAFISSCAGCVLLCKSLSYERHDPVNLITGLVLLSIGSLWRNIMAWLCVPVFGIAAIAIVLHKRVDGASIAKALARLWPFILAVVIGFGLTVYDLAVWKASPWDEWRTYNDTRSMLSDFPHYKYDEIQDELEAIGISRNDYELVFSWTTEDPEFFTTEKLQQLTDVALIDWVEDKSPFSIVKDYAKTILSSGELILLVLGTLIAGLCFTKGRGRWWALAVIAMALLMALFFSAMGRLPQRVHYPVWLYTLCAIGMIQYAFHPIAENVLAEKAPKHANTRQLGKAGAAFATVACFVVALAPVYAGVTLTKKCVDTFTPQRLAVTFNADNYEIDGPFTNYIHENSDKVFVLHNHGHRQLRMEHYMKAYYDDELQFHVVSLGGWLTRSTYNNTKNSSLNMDNPIRGLVDNRNARLVVSSKDRAENIERYIQEHYYPDAKGEVVDTLGKKQGLRTKLYIYQFTRG